MKVVKRYFSMLLVLALIVPIASATLTGPDLRAMYATTLIDLAGSNDYRVECGGADVLNRKDLLPQIDGYPPDPAVCILHLAEDKKAVMFSISAQADDPKKVIEHLGSYNDQAVSNTNIIKSSNLNVNACNSPDDAGEGWGYCDGAVSGLPYQVRVYRKIGLPVTYMITYGFTPSFDESWWDNIVEFFRNLLGFENSGGLDTLQSFTRGYFAHASGSGERTVHSFYYTQTGDTATDGEATIIFSHFAMDVSSLAPDATYELGHDNKQILHFSSISAHRWRDLTAALRITPNGEPPMPGDVCGNEILGFDEDCEIMGGTFVGHAASCEDIGFDMGSLSCLSSCEYDTSGCVNCQDLDQDGYFSANGEPGELRAVNSHILIGSLQADTIYDNTQTGYAEDQASREAAEISIQAIPLPLEHFMDVDIPGNDLENLITTKAQDLLVNFTDCLATSSESACYTQVLSTEHSGVDLISGFITERMLEEDEITSIAPCSISSGSLSCPNMEPGSLGDFGTNYKMLLTALASEEITPLFIIDPGRFATLNFGEAPTTQNYEARLQTALACAALDRAITNVLGLPEVAGTNLVADSYVYLASPLEPSQYYEGYQACRVGLHSAHATILYYNPGPGISDSLYGRVAEAALAAGTTPARVVDGFVTASPEAFVLPHVVTYGGGSIITLQELRSLTQSRLLVLPATLEESHGLLISAYRAGAWAIIYPAVKSPLVGDSLVDDADELTPRAALAAQIRESMAISQAFVPNSYDTPQAPMLLGYGGATNYVYFTSDQQGIPLPFDFSACENEQFEQPSQTGEFIDSGLEASDFELSTPGTGLYRAVIADWGCFIDDETVIGACSASGLALDCNDNETPIGIINPGAVEICDDGIDNDCDGLIDLQDECQNDPYSTGGGCNYNNVCEDDTENPYTCSDCVECNACPIAWTTAAERGAYRFEVRAGDKGEPELRVTRKTPPSGTNSGTCFCTGNGNDADSCVFHDQVIYPHAPGTDAIMYERIKHTSGGDWDTRIRVYANQSHWIINGVKEELQHEICTPQSSCDNSGWKCWACGPDTDPFCEELNISIPITTIGSCDPGCPLPLGCTDGSGVGWGESCTSSTDCCDGLVCSAGICRVEITCFTAGTQILMADGSSKPIEEVMVGDILAAYDETTGKPTTTVVENTLVHEIDKEILIINERIHVTKEHPIFTQRGWVLAEELVEGDVLSTPQGTQIITSINTTWHTGLVYNLHNNPHNNYYAEGVLVHNKIIIPDVP